MSESNRNTERRLKLSNIFKPLFIKEWMALWKKVGFSGFVKEKGWKVVVVVIVFYLIRDSILYIIIPILAAKGLLGC